MRKTNFLSYARTIALGLLVGFSLLGCSTSGTMAYTDDAAFARPLKVVARFSLPCGDISGETVFSQDLAYVDLDGCPDGWSSATHASTDRGYIYDLRRHEGMETRLAEGYRDKALGSYWGDIGARDVRFIGADRRIYWLKESLTVYKSDHKADCGLGVIKIEGFDKVKSCLLIFSLAGDGTISPLPTTAFKEDVVKDAAAFVVGKDDLIFGYDTRFFHPILLKLMDGRWQPYRTNLPAVKLNTTGDNLVSDKCGWAYAETFYCAYYSFSGPDEHGLLRYDTRTGETTVFPGIATRLPIGASNGLFLMTGYRNSGRNISWSVYDRDGRKLYDSETGDERGTPPYIGFPGKRDWGGADPPKFTPDAEYLYAIRSPKEFDIYQTKPFKRLITLKPDIFGLPYFETLAVDVTTGNVLVCAQRDCVIAKVQYPIGGKG